jgi:hypothetical protein
MSRVTRGLPYRTNLPKDGGQLPVQMRSPRARRDCGPQQSVPRKLLASKRSLATGPPTGRAHDTVAVWRAVEEEIGRPGTTCPAAMKSRATIRPDAYIQPACHYSLLASIEDTFSLPRLGYAGAPGLNSFGADVFNARPDTERYPGNAGPGRPPGTRFFHAPAGSIPIFEDLLCPGGAGQELAVPELCGVGPRSHSMQQALPFFSRAPGRSSSSGWRWTPPFTAAVSGGFQPVRGLRHHRILVLGNRQTGADARGALPTAASGRNLTCCPAA